MAQYTWTTCSKVIQSEVNTLRTELQRLLGQNLLDIYPHGSLALGGFQPGRSDIDLIVMTAQRLDLETKRRCPPPPADLKDAVSTRHPFPG
jgi:predicted nucleotidyltransferase